jgi:hypothetical protein
VVEGRRRDDEESLGRGATIYNASEDDPAQNPQLWF